MRGASNLVDMQKFSQWKIEECHEKIGADGAVNDGYNEDDDFELQQILALSRDLKWTFEFFYEMNISYKHN